ncbi:MAG: hypothetical protein ACXWMK_12620, partial [Syntrophales bacterium]
VKLERLYRKVPLTGCAFAVAGKRTKKAMAIMMKNFFAGYLIFYSIRHLYRANPMPNLFESSPHRPFVGI